jgi:hypothetical protein
MTFVCQLQEIYSEVESFDWKTLTVASVVSLIWPKYARAGFASIFPPFHLFSSLSLSLSLSQSISFSITQSLSLSA